MLYFFSFKDSIISSLVSVCQLFPSTETVTKVSRRIVFSFLHTIRWNLPVHGYVQSVSVICQLLDEAQGIEKVWKWIDNHWIFQRYATLCRLMSACTNELITEKPPVILGQNRCTWGPSYWCSSLSKSRECNSVEHCSNQIWSQQAIQKKPNDNICQYCEYIIGKLRTFILNKTTEVDSKQIETWNDSYLDLD